MSKPAFNSQDDPDLPRAAPARSFAWIIVVGLLAVALLLLTQRSGGRSYGTKHASVGKSPERFQLVPLTGDPPSLNLESLQGKVTLVNFWGTWCPPCQVEFPHVVALWDELRENPEFQMAAVSCEGQEKDLDELRANTLEFLKTAKTDLPTYCDPQGLSRIATMDATGEELAYPTTLLFGRDGKILAFWRGYQPGMEEEVSDATRAALAQK
jgi:thiol-disulfide isomerase/thioredoxin